MDYRINSCQAWMTFRWLPYALNITTHMSTWWPTLPSIWACSCLNSVRFIMVSGVLEYYMVWLLSQFKHCHFWIITSGFCTFLACHSHFSKKNSTAPCNSHMALLEISSNDSVKVYLCNIHKAVSLLLLCCLSTCLLLRVSWQLWVCLLDDTFNPTSDWFNDPQFCVWKL